MRLAAALACMGIGCVGGVVERAPAAISQVPVGGSSPLSALVTQLAADEGVAPDELAAASWVRERFWIDGDAVAALRDDAAAVRDGSIEGAIDAALARGIDGRDRDGGRIVVAARRIGGFGEIAQGLDFAGATWAPASTSNYQTGSRGLTDIDHIVIHDTEGNFDGAVSWFQDPAAQVSAHYVVRSSDGHVVQMVHDKDVAWHDKCFNTHTIGVEHEGFMAHPDVWYTEAMYTSSATLVAALADTYGIAKEHGTILGHGEAPDCSDHTDPGPGWDWAHYIDLVKTGGAPQLAGDTAEVTGPGALVEGEVGDVMIQLANTGTAAWDVDATRLGTALPQDHDSVLAGADVAWPAPSRPTSVAAHTAPGETGAFAFQIQAPHVTHGTVIDEAFQLVEADGTWFGPTMHVVVLVTPVRDAPQDPQAMSGCAAGAGSTNGGCAILVAAGVLGPALRRRRRRR